MVVFANEDDISSFLTKSCTNHAINLILALSLYSKKYHILLLACIDEPHAGGRGRQHEPLLRRP